MSNLRIDFEWIDPLGARGAELRATWARLCVVVDGSPITRIYDERSRTVRDAIYLPLYPLAEWLAEQWWPLWGEPASSAAGRPDYERRHSMAHAREGYALPPVRIEPEGSLVRVSWASERLLSHQLEFTGHGEVSLETEPVRDAFSSLIDAVVGRLEAEGITETCLQEDWAAIRTADADEREFCECTGALGLDPYSLDENRQHEIEEVGQALPRGIVTEFFRAARASSEGLRMDADEATAAAARVENNEAELAPFRELREEVATWARPQGHPPWEQGYSFAQRLRSHLKLDGTALKSLDRIGEAIGATQAQLSTVLSRFSCREIPFAALVGINDRLSPAFVLRPGRQMSDSFHFGRALFEYLYPSGQGTALITDANTGQQKRNRAFAAELLAPASELRARLRTQTVTWEQAEEIAEEFGVSAYVIAHQLNNHQVARVEAV